MADVYTATENVMLSITAPGVLDNDSDGDGNTLMVITDTTTMSGTLMFVNNGSFDLSARS